MGDVVTALARAVQDEGHQVTCIVPKYDCMNYKEVRACALSRSCILADMRSKSSRGACLMPGKPPASICSCQTC